MVQNIKRCLAAFAVGLALSGCATPITGTPMAVDGAGATQHGGPSPDDYEPSAQYGSFSTAPQDQPIPIPSWEWDGWADHGGFCAALPAGLFDGIAAAPPAPTGHFCSFPTTEDTRVQIFWGDIPGPFIYDPLAFLDETRVAGLNAISYDLRTNQDTYPGSCSVAVDTRSLSSYAVLVWTETKRPLDRARSCELAGEVAGRIATARVPLAGGAVWEPTPQRPTTVPSDPCEVVDDLVATHAGLAHKEHEAKRGAGALGPTCLIAKNKREAAVLLTAGPRQGLADTAPPEGARTEDLRIGPLPARKEVMATACAIAVEPVPGRLLRVQYRQDEVVGNECMYARHLVMVALARLIHNH
ncbi:hypothetical protein ACOBQX_30235 [Actinokineospora sp. G85]|uniref:hypothetical protein n=1 Tax=Actinokineospora sp. G85 TaxID=3406626 RepID=UPI003C715ABA